jgi:hypothetical protein
MSLTETPGVAAPAPAPGGAGFAHPRSEQAFLSEVATTENTSQGQGFDAGEAQRFLTVLGKDPAKAHFRTIKPGGRTNTRRNGADLTRWDPAELAADCAAGENLYIVTGNIEEDVDIRCVKDADIESCTALFAEWDDKPIGWQLTAWREKELPEPTTQINTGGKSVHNYWALEEPIDPQLWRDVIKRLIAHCQSDKSCKNPSRLMRLPGSVYYDKTTGEAIGRAEIVGGSGNRVSLADILAALPPEAPTVPPEAPQAEQRHNTRLTAGDLPPRGLDAIRAAARYIPQRVPGTGNYEPSRRALCGCSAAIAATGESEAASDAMALDLLAPLWPSRAAAQQVLNTSITRDPGAFWAIAGENGFDLGRHDLGKPNNPGVTPIAASQQQEDSEGEKETVRATTYSDLIGWTLDCIKEENEDGEMECRAELKQRFRLSDEQIETALFKRHSAENIKKTDAEHNSLDMESIEQLGYLMDGWIPKGDVVLTYGSYGTGKTTLAMAKMHAHVTGKNLLDRDTPCIPGRGLFIATDSGAAPLKKTMADLGMDPDTNPLMKPGHPDQRIWIWAHQPSQGHGSWICNIHGVIRLERFIRENRITYVVIDSAKSVSSAAGWSYTSNESVKALLQYLREGIAQPTGCCLEFLSHDGTEKGSHSGAKAWAEDPSMVIALEAAIDPESKKFTGIVAKFRKDRAAVVDARRELRYGLNDGQLERHPDTEVVSNCTDALLTILWEAHQSGQSGLRGIDLKTEALVRFNRSSRTVENTLGKIAGSGRGPTPTPVIRTGRGRYSLAPAEIERRTAANPNRTPPFSGGGCTKSIAAQGVYPPPLETPDGGIGGFENPPLNPLGVSKGGDQTPTPNWDLPQIPPDGGRGGGVSETSADQPYESPERLADTREERLPQAAREERDADQLWLQQRGLTSTASQPAGKAPGSPPPPWLADVLAVRDLAPPGTLPAVLVNNPDLAQWRHLTGGMAKTYLTRFDAGEWPQLRTQPPADAAQGGVL